jgi:hypothetical protein
VRRALALGADAPAQEEEPPEDALGDDGICAD